MTNIPTFQRLCSSEYSDLPSPGDMLACYCVVVAAVGVIFQHIITAVVTYLPMEAFAMLAFTIGVARTCQSVGQRSRPTPGVLPRCGSEQPQLTRPGLHCMYS
ncbi:hypothetical protein PMIN02_011101 [Paraphaeosphaeria minitans]